MRQKGDMWVDPQGKEIPLKYVRKHIRFDEAASHAIISKAESLNDSLVKFKEYAFKKVVESYNKKITEHGINGKEPKGNYTLYSFDRTLKISLSINEGIGFDEVLIGEAQRLFTRFVHENLNEDQVAIGQIILSAFEKKAGSLDAKRILSLHRFRNDIKDENFQRALNLVDDSTTAINTKSYLQFYKQNSEGEYEAIQLNFSAI